MPTPMYYEGHKYSKYLYKTEPLKLELYSNAIPQVLNTVNFKFHKTGNIQNFKFVSLSQ